MDDGDEPAGEMPDELICPIDRMFYRKYQLPCKHLWHYDLLFNSFKDSDWLGWAELFEDGGFEVYETTVKEYVNREERIEGPDRHMLEMREVLDSIKDKYYAMMEHTT